jgi:trimethylguanosine synthase
MTILLTRTDLYDAGGHHENHHELQNAEAVSTLASPPRLGYPPPPAVAPFSYDATTVGNTDPSIAICRVADQPEICNPEWLYDVNVYDKTVANPFGTDLTKYWNQRRRLFRRFDEGIQLDPEGWFSVTPEQIADLVATRTVSMCQQKQQRSTSIVVLDAFCGCGGNSIAFARQSQIQTVICCDIDRTKLLSAANNAAIYGIPYHKIIFVECNVLFILEHCYRNGNFVLDQPMDTPEQVMAMMQAMPPPVVSETAFGYVIGGIDLLPRHIHVVFMDPPWGGVDYSVFGKHGYCLQRNMLIPRPAHCAPSNNNHCQEGLGNGFFDCFQAEPRNKQERKAAFNSGLDETNCVNGAELLALAAAASEDGMVVYDVPRNTNRHSLAQAALFAGYHGHCKVEEHHLNGRLKTTTIYFGIDWRRDLIPEQPQT